MNLQDLRECLYNVNPEGKLVWCGFYVIGVHEIRSTVSDYVYLGFVTVSEHPKDPSFDSWC